MKFLITILLSIISISLCTDVLDITGWARCIDTTRFLKKLQKFRAQMSPLAPKGLKINYRPAVETETFSNGTRFVSCAKGRLECDLSKYQACAKKYIKSENSQLAMIMCIQGASLKTAEGCAKKTLGKNGSVSISNQIKKCAESSESVDLLFKENASKPKKITWLPWITVNGTRIAAMEGNPKKYLCQMKSMKWNKACF